MSLAVGFVLLTAAVAWPCGGYGPDEPTGPLQLPGTIAQAVVRGNQLFATTGDGQLLAIDLRKNTVRSLASFDKMGPVLGLAGAKACVAAKNHLHLVDVNTGKLVCSKEFGHPVLAAGFLSEQRVYVITNSALNIVDLAADKTVATIDLGKSQGDSYRAMLDGCRAAVIGEGAGQRLLVPVGTDKAALAVIDPEKGKVVDQIAMPGISLGGIHTVGAIQVMGDKVFVVCWRLSYGVWTQSFGCVDLKERTCTLLKLPSRVLLHGQHLAMGPNGQQFLTSQEYTHQYDAQGKLVGSLFTKGEGRLVGIQKGLALLVKEKELVRVPLPSAVTVPTE
jgi:hypothetical protein